jgi:perosamine synthetase|tara:strand:+ start:995 stop:2140 length:1146 start_codon:yes stop_codon:yes gene_type:complete
MKKILRSKNKFIPVNKPIVFNDDIKMVVEVLKKKWISGDSPYVKIFESQFASFNKRKYAIAVSNGTAALEVALKSLNLQKGSEVIVPTFSIISTALCVVKNNLKPVLVDSDLINWNMIPEQIIKKINKKTKAIIITHIYGYPVDMKKILKIAKQKKIIVIEDAAEMIGQKYNGKICGSFGDISTFSFYANKHITTGEGGMILTNNRKIFKKCKSLRNLCFGVGAHRYNHDDIGWNYRMSTMQAAMGISQLKKIKYLVKRKKEIGRLYFSLLKNNRFIKIQKPSLKYADNIYWVFGVLLNPNLRLTRDKVVKKLSQKNIQTRNFFYPMHKQKIFQKLKIFSKNLKYPNSEFLSKNGFYLPSGLGITNKEIKYVCSALNLILS